MAGFERFASLNLLDPLHVTAFVPNLCEPFRLHTGDGPHCLEITIALMMDRVLVQQRGWPVERLPIRSTAPIRARSIGRCDVAQPGRNRENCCHVILQFVANQSAATVPVRPSLYTLASGTAASRAYHDHTTEYLQ